MGGMWTDPMFLPWLDKQMSTIITKLNEGCSRSGGILSFTFIFSLALENAS